MCCSKDSASPVVQLLHRTEVVQIQPLPFPRIHITHPFISPSSSSGVIDTLPHSRDSSHSFSITSDPHSSSRAHASATSSPAQKLELGGVRRESGSGAAVDRAFLCSRRLADALTLFLPAVRFTNRPPLCSQSTQPHLPPQPAHLAAALLRHSHPAFYSFITYHCPVCRLAKFVAPIFSR